MTVIVNVQEAKTRLSELLRRVELGERVTIARAGQAIARLEPVEQVRRRFDAPLIAGVPPIDIDELLMPLSDDDLSAWERGHAGDPLGEDSA